jgi:hypothetical protein
MVPGNRSLDDLLRSLWQAGSSPLQAYAQNYRCDERASPQRQQAYEAALGEVADFDAWDRWHRDKYLPQAIHRAVPETFTAANAAAAHAGSLDTRQDLLRLETLDKALGPMGFTVDELATALAVARGEAKPGNYSKTEAEDALLTLCGLLNDNEYSIRPRFAGFFQDVEDSLSLPDWPNQIRDRFGLGHRAATSGAPIPVVLLRYPVKDVLEMVKNQPEAVHPICMPTVLDTEFSQFFVPAPRELPYGRTLDLADDAHCQRKIAEILHPRLEYRPEHVCKIGVITTGLDILDKRGLAALRDNHITCLQLDSERYDFGQPPEEWSHA